MLYNKKFNLKQNSFMLKKNYVNNILLSFNLNSVEVLKFILIFNFFFHSK